MFLGRIKNSNNRDCVKYMRFEGFECGHYFSGLHIYGACFFGGIKELKENIDNFETILSKKELEYLFELDSKLKDLGYGIEKDSEKYNQGMQIIKEFNNTIGKKLQSEENEQMFKKIIEEEKEIIKQEWNLGDEDIEEIFNNYPYEYRDRAIITCVYAGAYELGESEIDDCFNVEEFIKKYIDFEKFGEDLISNNDDRYIELQDGRIVELST